MPPCNLDSIDFLWCDAYIKFIVFVAGTDIFLIFAFTNFITIIVVIIVEVVVGVSQRYVILVGIQTHITIKRYQTISSSTFDSCS